MIQHIAFRLDVDAVLAAHRQASAHHCAQNRGVRLAPRLRLFRGTVIQMRTRRVNLFDSADNEQ